MSFTTAIIANETQKIHYQTIVLYCDFMFAVKRKQKFIVNVVKRYSIMYNSIFNGVLQFSTL